ncbi:MAG: hypothetical protein AAB654_07040, partial [Acidobacteriota bacterium]
MIETPTITAPLASVTRPTTLADDVCAAALAAAASNTAIKVRSLIQYPVSVYRLALEASRAPPHLEQQLQPELHAPRLVGAGD